MKKGRAQIHSANSRENDRIVQRLSDKGRRRERGCECDSVSVMQDEYHTA